MSAPTASNDTACTGGAVGAGIINGTSPTTLEPRSNATRAEIATMLCRLVDFLTNN